MGDRLSDNSARQATNQRLDSWKEIAGFFGRDERTVRRWEKERGLPVHRVPGGGRGGVFAYTAELGEWLKGRADELASSDSDSFSKVGEAVQIKAVEIKAFEIKDGAVLENEAKPCSDPQGSSLASAPVLAPVLTLPSVSGPVQSHAALGRYIAWLTPLVLVVGLIGLVSFSNRESRYKNALAAPHGPNSEAQELYLKGQYHWTKRTPDDLNKAVDYFTQSIVKDPGYAQAYVGLADCYNLLREFSIMPAYEAYPRALSAAQKAVELDDNSSGAHTSLAFSTFYWNWDPVTAESEFKRALQIDPNFVQGHHWYATFLLANARFPEALDQIEQARKLDPSSTTIQADKGWILHAAGRKNEAFALLKQLESTDPALATTHGYLAAIYLERKDYPNFFAESKQSAQLRHDEAGMTVVSAAERGFAADGVNGMRESMLPAQREMFSRGLGSAYDLAATSALLGKKEEALHYLQAAYDKRETGLLYLSRDADFSSLHDDLLYKEINERVSQQLSRPSKQY